MFKKIMEIKSKKGVLHFRRWRIMETPWFGIYIHGIYKADKDLHLHDHPWNYMSVVLKGAYLEASKVDGEIRMARPVQWKWNNATRFHKIALLVTPSVYTLFITGKKYREWGYDVDGVWVDNQTYRNTKNNFTP